MTIIEENSKGNSEKIDDCSNQRDSVLNWEVKMKKQESEVLLSVSSLTDKYKKIIAKDHDSDVKNDSGIATETSENNNEILSQNETIEIKPGVYVTSHGLSVEIKTDFNKINNQIIIFVPSYANNAVYLQISKEKIDFKQYNEKFIKSISPNHIIVNQIPSVLEALPNGKLGTTIKAVSTHDQRAEKFIFCQQPDIYISNGCIIAAEETPGLNDKHNNGLLSKISDICVETNKKIKDNQLDDYQYYKLNSLGFYNIIHPDKATSAKYCNEQRSIVCSNKELTSKDILKTVQHECNHALFHSLSNDIVAKLEIAHFKLQEMEYNQMKNLSENLDLDLIPAKEYDQNSIWDLFNEYRYQKSFDPVTGEEIEPGHAQDNESELFASLNCVIKIFPNEFKKKLKDIKMSNTTKYELIKIINLYLKAANSDTQLNTEDFIDGYIR